MSTNSSESKSLTKKYQIGDESTFVEDDNSNTLTNEFKRIPK